MGTHRRAVITAAVGAGLVLAGCTAQPTPDPVDSATASSVETPVYDGTWDEWSQDYLACLREQGWSVERGDPNEGISFEADVPDGQESSFLASQNTCNADVGRIETDVQDEAVVREAYDGLLTQFSCLQGAGFTPKEPPSFDSFLDASRSGVATWDPMLGVADVDYQSALAACPRGVPGS